MVLEQEAAPMRIIGLDEARKNLSKIVQEANVGKTRFLLSTRGKPQAIVIGVEDYIRNVLKRDRLSVIAEIQLEARSRGRDKLTMREINKEIRAARREVSRRSA
jgi:prevent-host-death family protein